MLWWIIVACDCGMLIFLVIELELILLFKFGLFEKDEVVGSWI